MVEPLFYIEKNVENPPVIDGKSVSTINFIGVVEGWKFRCKQLHWASRKKNIHVYLDEFLQILSDYQDSIAEDVMGISGNFNVDTVKCVPCNCENAKVFIANIKLATESYYNTIPSDTEYVGIKSETENFIHNINKYKYLFSISAETLFQ